MLVAGMALAMQGLGFWGATQADEAKPGKQKPYPLETCVVSGEKLGGDMGEPSIFVHEGREIKLCCKSCLKDFQADPAKYVAKVDAAARKVKPYPLETCVVSGESFGGSMGEPYVFVHQGREIKLCCKSCLKEFEKQPAKFLAKVDEAAKQVKPYPLKTCLVSGEALGGMGESYVFIRQGQEIKLCCEGCLAKFEKDPPRYLKQLKVAAR